MEEAERVSLVSQWWRELTIDQPAPPLRISQLVGTLVGKLADGMDADPFDDTIGVSVGAALAEAGLLDPAAPAALAPILHRMAADSDRPDADERASALLATISHGHYRALRDLTPATGEAAAHALPPRRVEDELLRLAVENAPFAITINEIDGRLIYANRAMTDMLGVPLETLRRISMDIFTHPEEREEVQGQIFGRLRAARQGTVHLERRLLRPDGSIRWTEYTVTYVPGTGGQDDFAFAVAHDVTERHRLQQRLHWQARHDQLTGLPNRRYLIERIEAIIACADDDDRIGLCFADLDRFKDINDRYGHVIGDQVLVAVAERLRESLHEYDCTIARLGGDEFVTLIAPPAEDHRVDAVTDRLLSALATPISVGEYRLNVSASVGAVVTAVAGQQATALLEAADRELYRAKTGRPEIVHPSSADDR